MLSYVVVSFVVSIILCIKDGAGAQDGAIIGIILGSLVLDTLALVAWGLAKIAMTF
jgi:hypothetical protein